MLRVVVDAAVVVVDVFKEQYLSESTVKMIVVDSE